MISPSRYDVRASTRLSASLASVTLEVREHASGGEQNAALVASRTVIRPNRRIAIIVGSHLPIRSRTATIRYVRGIAESGLGIRLVDHQCTRRSSFPHRCRWDLR